MKKSRIKNTQNKRRLFVGVLALLVILAILIGVSVYVAVLPKNLEYKTSSLETSSKTPESILAIVQDHYVAFRIFTGPGVIGLSPTSLDLHSGPSLSNDGKAINLDLYESGGGDVAPEHPRYHNIERDIEITNQLEPGEYRVSVKIFRYTTPPGPKPVYVKTLTASFQIKS